MTDLDPSEMTVAKLKVALKARGLKVSGKKAELIERLEADLANFAEETEEPEAVLILDEEDDSFLLAEDDSSEEAEEAEEVVEEAVIFDDEEEEVLEAEVFEAEIIEDDEPEIVSKPKREPAAKSTKSVV